VLPSLTHECVLEMLKFSSNVNELKPLEGGIFISGGLIGTGTIGVSAPPVVRTAWSCRREPFNHPLLGQARSHIPPTHVRPGLTS